MGELGLYLLAITITFYAAVLYGAVWLLVLCDTLFPDGL